MPVISCISIRIPSSQQGYLPIYRAHNRLEVQGIKMPLLKVLEIDLRGRIYDAHEAMRISYDRFDGPLKRTVKK
jgi:hypothetical protein